LKPPHLRPFDRGASVRTINAPLGFHLRKLKSIDALSRSATVSTHFDLANGHRLLLVSLSALIVMLKTRAVKNNTAMPLCRGQKICW
jgi:ABC-type metal ion transport system substrate-binding protein